MRPDSLCACGCGGVARRRFIRGHNTKNGGSRWLGCQRKGTASATHRPTQRDLGWAAGFLEGEGSFTRPSGETEMVMASQVQREPLERLLAMFGGKISTYAPPSLGYRRIHRWFVNGARARGVLMTLFGLMSPRRQQQMRVALGLT